ncbi:MAG: glutaredoxin family protein [Chloroflexi bacterium]|nr:glutaredoxin family protein [Chloroflexota bacterium]
MPTVTPPLPDLVLYTRAGCGLCEEARRAVDLLLADREERGLPVPTLRVRDIEADPELHRKLFERIPVIELGGRRLELATSASRLRRLLEDVLDGPRPAVGLTADPRT